MEISFLSFLPMKMNVNKAGNSQMGGSGWSRWNPGLGWVGDGKRLASPTVYNGKLCNMYDLAGEDLI